MCKHTLSYAPTDLTALGVSLRPAEISEAEGAAAAATATGSSCSAVGGKGEG